MLRVSIPFTSLLFAVTDALSRWRKSNTVGCEVVEGASSELRQGRHPSLRASTMSDKTIALHEECIFQSLYGQVDRLLLFPNEWDRTS